MINLNTILRGGIKKAGDASPVIAQLDRPAPKGFAAILKADSPGTADPAIKGFSTNTAWATRRKIGLRLW